MPRTRPLIILVTPAVMRDEVTRGSTSAVKTFHAVATTMRMPAMRPITRAASTAVILPDAPGPACGFGSGAPLGQAVGRLAGCDERGGHVDEPGPQELAQPLGLRVEAQVRRHAPAQDPAHDEVDGAEVRQGVPATSKRASSGSSVRKASVVKSARSHLATSSSSAQTPTLASPPLSPSVRRAARRAGPGSARPAPRRPRWRPGRRHRGAATARAHPPAPDHAAPPPPAPPSPRTRRAAPPRRGDGRGPVTRHALRARGRRREERPGIARQARLDDGAGEGPPTGGLVVPATASRSYAMPPPVRSPLRSSAVSANAPRPPGIPATPLPPRSAPFSTTRAPVTGASWVAPARVQVRRHLERRRRRLAAHAGDAHSVHARPPPARACQARHGVGAQVLRSPIS